ncbi:MAG: hypothetical protein F6J98_34895 [Moorea sp. SIO4G2]|nr:hypothetical protein [Moorena sp. SIO4G2]
MPKPQRSGFHDRGDSRCSLWAKESFNTTHLETHTQFLRFEVFVCESIREYLFFVFTYTHQFEMSQSLILSLPPKQLLSF